ncbi:MAG: helix-turn-helix transcriptional regulator [Bacteroidota bacterium]|nr:helix-turn-helix transcriptional regulator [Bacteroidota bacterium]
MTFGQKLASCRKEQRLSKAEIGKRSGVNGDIVGKYERDEIKPSIDTAAKIADALNVTIDFLVKDGEYQNIDNDALKRLRLLEKLNPKDKDHIYALMDAFFAKYKMDSLLQ